MNNSVVIGELTAERNHAEKREFEILGRANALESKLKELQGENEDYIKDLVAKNDSLRAQVWQIRHALETAKHQSRCMACELRAEAAEAVQEKPKVTLEQLLTAWCSF